MKQWNEFIADRLMAQAFSESYGNRNCQPLTRVMDAVITDVLESDWLPKAILGTMQGGDIDFAKRIDETFEYYCDRHAEELKDQFPEEFAEFKETDEGDEVNT